ncbi:YadA-like family protein [Avibacterium sp. 21-586]|uniref:YadA family autotransporter adhesin n=1 Tax=Avibacterium sp. 21-586 TaxID=2911534 RepID=UPI002245C46B|nr:YadA-like family protein [Avibacterium sp. 21-586]MCW9709658.1 YadA-like family protein [Avibacterium sp. 21-586]
MPEAVSNPILGISEAPKSSGKVKFADQVYVLNNVNEADKIAVQKTVKRRHDLAHTGAVSVGSDSATRQIINVAAGSIDTDAVNVAQLKAVANTGIKYAGDKLDPSIEQNGGNPINEFVRVLGQRTNVKGEAKGELSDENIGVLSNGTDTLTVKLAKQLKSLDSITFGDVIPQTGKPTVPDKTVVVSKNGINAGNKSITNIAGNLNGAKTAPSVDDVNKMQNNAATVGDLLNVGWSLQNNGREKDFIKPYDTVNFSNGANTLAVVDPISELQDNVRINLTGLPIAYTDVEGHLLVKVGDKFYKVEDVTDGKVNAGKENADAEPVSITLVNKDNIAKPQTLDNVKSAINPDGNKTGGDFTKALDQAAENSPNKAVNVSDLKNVSDNIKNLSNSIKNTSNGGGFGLKDDDGKEVKQDLGTTIEVLGKDGVSVKVVDIAEKVNIPAHKALEVSLDNDITIGDDKNSGTITVKGKSGKDSVAIDGNAGGSIIVGGESGKDGVDGQPGIVLKGKNGVIGLTGPAGKNGKSPKADISLAFGGSGIRGNDGPADKDNQLSKTRIIYEKPDGTEEEVATLNDGIKYIGDFGDGAAIKLNKITELTGNITDDKNIDNFVDGNIAVVASQNQEDGKLSFKLAKDLVGLDSVIFGLVDSVSGKIVDPKNTVLIGKEGINAGSKKITNVAKGTDGTDAVNVNQLNDVIKGVKGKPTSVKSSGNNITVIKSADKNAEGGDEYVVSMNKDITIGKFAKDDQPGEAGTIRVAGKDGKDGVTLTVKEGGKPGIDGKDTKPRLDVNGEDVATLSDGLKFEGNQGGIIEKKLNNTVTVKGALDNNADATASNTRVDIENGELIIKMAKMLKDLEGVEFKDRDGNTVVVKNGSIVIISKNNSDKAVKLSGNGLDNGGNTITNVADGVNPKDAVNKRQLDQKMGAFKVTTNSDNAKSKEIKNLDTVDFINGNNTVVSKMDTPKGTKVKVDLAKDLRNLNSIELKDSVGNVTNVTANGISITGTNAVGKASNVNLTADGLDNGGNRITNVAPGVKGTDAINVNQFNAMGNRIDNVDRKARGGIASSTAMANLPQSYIPGHSIVAVAAGTYRGANAVAVGISRISDSGHVIIKLSGSTDSKGGTNAGAGVGYLW